MWLSEDYARAAPGGTGAAKAAATTPPRSSPRQQAVEQGCDQVVWLDAAEHRWVEEMGGMNLFFVFGARAARAADHDPRADRHPAARHHPRLAARLAPELGIKAAEDGSPLRRGAQCASGELTEVFACGTAAVVTPVGRVKGASGEWLVGDGAPGPVTMRLRDELIGIQNGRLADPFGWLHKVC